MNYIKILIALLIFFSCLFLYMIYFKKTESFYDPNIEKVYNKNIQKRKKNLKMNINPKNNNIKMKLKHKNKIFDFEIKLFDNELPKTTKNFRQLCGSGINGISYKNNIFHRVISGFMLQGGDITNQNGTGGMSIYGEKFDDEAFYYKHDQPGLLSMANSGPNTNGSQFFITTVATPHLDDKHVVFGKLVKGLEHLNYLENVETDDNDCPLEPITIISSI